MLATHRDGLWHNAKADGNVVAEDTRLERLDMAANVPAERKKKK